MVQKSICIYLFASFENTVLEIFTCFPKFDDAEYFGFVIQQVIDNLCSIYNYVIMTFKKIKTFL